MKKLLVSAAALAALPLAAQAQDDAQLTMTASISERCEVSLVGTNPNVLFGLDQTVANVDFVCNLPGIIDIKVTSANDGNLSGPSDIPYTVDIDPNNVSDTNISGSGDNLSFTAGVIDLTTTAPGVLLGGAQVDFRINVSNVENNGASLFAGDYSDTVTFEIGPDGTL